MCSNNNLSYMKCCNYNVLSVDYNPIAREPCYIEAARNTEPVGMCTAQLIDQLVQKYGFNLTQFHIIGFSRGGQTAGFIGDYVTSGRLDRITGQALLILMHIIVQAFVKADLRGLTEIKQYRFYEKFHIPGVLGCIDGTHVAIVRPTEHEERYFNRKHYHSRNVQIICDSEMNILNVDATFGGATHDSFIFNQHPIKTHLLELLSRGETAYLLGISSTKADFDCIAPPMECPNENVTFWLYTRENEEKSHQVLAMDQQSIESAPWVHDAPVKILIHGYTGHKDFSPNTEIRPAYMKCCNYNLISVDYNPIAREPCYIEAARNTELVGMCTAQLIDQLVQKYGFNLTQFHIIGFSLGGQTAGFIGDYVTSGRLDRVTALDPAMPLFVTTDSKKKIDKGDAKFVDVLHTNALEKGKLEASGHVDFYANGGITQPGCKATKEQTKSGCNHARAPKYYAESITTDVGFYATKCYSWIIYMIGWCEMFNSTDEVLFGEYVPKNVHGLYFFSTNSESPYARGSNQKSRRKRSSNYFR